MNALAMPFKQLVERKLWPLAILLLAALVAVPMLLASKDAGVPAPPAGAVTASASQTALGETQPIVTLGTAEQRETRRKVLGARKNPFKPVPTPQAKAADATTTTAPNTSVVKKESSGGASSGGGAAAPVVGVAPAAPAAPLAPKRTYELFSLKIRFGPTSSLDLANRSIKRLTALPKMSEPTLVYLGLKKDLKTAVFLVDANTLVVGDGKCLPSPANCQNLELKKGQTAFVDVLGDDGQSLAQYELDLVSVIRKKTTNLSTARASRKAVAKGGRDALRANVARVRGLMYDPNTGTLKEPETKK
jgi:hypothetical protein